ncbi:hypothetical protein [Microbacterium sp. 179-I 3D3 NHS]|uniref:hypothetical protein n=1 Tax=Microbacterium sp. 179-I 3D3 NHS TaxID=3142382 RepID=UPI0039A314E9
MDRSLVFPAPVAVAPGHRVEVTELVDPLTGEAIAVMLVDLDTGIRYRRSDAVRGESERWIGRVLECAVTMTGGGAVRTVLRIDPIGPGAGAKGALRDADAAADAAKAEADRWGGTDRPPMEEPERFW